MWPTTGISLVELPLCSSGFSGKNQCDLRRHQGQIYFRNKAHNRHSKGYSSSARGGVSLARQSRQRILYQPSRATHDDHSTSLTDIPEPEDTSGEGTQSGGGGYSGGAGAVHPRVSELLQEREACTPQRTPEWLAERRRMLTASDVSAALGTNFFTTSDQLLQRKCATDGSQEKRPNAAMKHGNYYEGVALERYAAKTREKVLSFGLKTHDKYPWLGASPDGITESGRLVEVKCPYTKKKSLQGMKKRYYAQVQTQLEVFDLEVCDLVQYYTRSNSGRKKKPQGTLSMIEIKRDREWFRQNFESMKRFSIKLYTELGLDTTIFDNSHDEMLNSTDES